MLTTTLWDLKAGKRKFSATSLDVPSISYLDGGFVLRVYGIEDQQSVYFESEDQLITFPINDDGYIDDFASLPDHTLIYEQTRPYGGLMAGVYRYDPANDSYMLLVANATLYFGT